MKNHVILFKEDRGDSFLTTGEFVYFPRQLGLCSRRLNQWKQISISYCQDYNTRTITVFPVMTRVLFSEVLLTLDPGVWQVMPGVNSCWRLCPSMDACISRRIHDLGPAANRGSIERLHTILLFISTTFGYIIIFITFLYKKSNTSIKIPVQ